MPQITGNLRSGALAKATGVSPDTIRHYERIGVLPRAARTESGYRVYPPSAVERVYVVQRALRVGFRLAELAEVLKSTHAVAQDMQSCPMHKEHSKEAQHQAEVERHGDQAMGFPHDKTTHHFRPYSDGGAIEVTANDGDDSANIQAVRSHLARIVGLFSKGDFSIPMFVHNQVPPGVPVMKEQHDQISYSFEELPAGGRVRIKTRNGDTLKAVHEFLQFQIEDHHTGDTTDTIPH